VDAIRCLELMITVILRIRNPLRARKDAPN